jgi:P27 family predicted phage terminase small subunit
MFSGARSFREASRLALPASYQPPKLNLITNLDPIATYGGTYAMWAEAMEQIQKHRATEKSPSSFPIQLPYLAIANQHAQIMMRIASELGFTPVSRSNISAWR